MIAMPTATGTPAKLSVTASSKRFSHSGLAPPASFDKMMLGITTEEDPKPKTKAAKASHLICSRSSPPERTKRNTKLKAEPSMHRGSSRVWGEPIRPDNLVSQLLQRDRM